jgi:hypothetical protein
MFGAARTLDELDAAVDKVAADEANLDVARLRRSIERLEHACTGDRAGPRHPNGWMRSSSWSVRSCKLRRRERRSNCAMSCNR